MKKDGFAFSTGANRKRNGPALKFEDSQLPPLKQPNGSYATLENCAARVCRWPYGLPGPEMVVCGRPGAPWCKEHRALAYPRKGK